MGLLTSALGALGVAYLVFWAPDGEYRFNSILIAALLLGLAPLWSGIWARSAGRGFVAGFVTILIPAMVYVSATLGWGLTGLRREPGVWTIDTLMGSLAGPLGSLEGSLGPIPPVLLIAPALLGLLAAVPGAIAGAVSGRISHTRMRRARPTEPTAGSVPFAGDTAL
jgi:hypothetical protein